MESGVKSKYLSLEKQFGQFIGRGRSEIVGQRQRGQGGEYGIMGVGQSGQGLLHIFCGAGEEVVAADGA